MFDIRRLAVLGALFAAILTAAAIPGCEPPKAPGPVLLFCADNQGVIAACGCPSNPSGGFAKRQGLIENYRRTRPAVLVVDAGDMFPDFDHPIKVKYLARGLARAKYDALGLGDQEFLVGAAKLRELAREHGLPFICANVRDAAGEPVVPPHVIREIGGRRVGIFSVIADRAYGFPAVEWRQGLTVEPPVEAARREVRALAGCDAVIALAHMPMDECRELAAEVSGLTAIICGHDPPLTRVPEKVNGALLLGTGDSGRVLGALTLAGGAPGRPELACRLTEISAQVAEAKWAMDLYWDYVKESKDKPPPDWNQQDIPDRYDPPDACNKCHPFEYRQWSKTRHAHAYEPIRKAGRQDDPECLLCHTMGLGRKGGFVSMAKTPQFGRVTCQACHLVAADHADRKIKPQPRINISSRLCMSCHGPVQSPAFDYFTYKPKILHKPPAGDARK